MRTLLQDLRYAVRTLRASPGFTAAVVLSLALGLGANTAIFSAVDGALLRPLPYRDADRLVTISSVFHQAGDAVGGLSLPDFRAFRDLSRAVAGMGAAYTDDRALTGDGVPEPARTGVITPGLLALLGAPPALGRELAPDEATWGRHHVVLISYALWQRRFGGDPAVLGRTLEVDGAPATIVGVAPRGLGFPRPGLDLLAPIVFPPGSPMDTRGNHFVSVIGRLAPGATVESARTEIAALAARLAREIPENQGIGSRVGTLRESLTGDVHAALLVLLGAVGLVLLIACANLANLLLARAAIRQREIAVRAALGASRARLVRQLLTESVLLAVIGGAAGVALASWLLDAIVAMAPESIRTAGAPTIDVRVLGFAVVLALVTGVGFGLLPALVATRLSLADTLKAGARSVAGGGAHRLRRALVIAEVALSLILLVGAGLLLRSFASLRQARLGFEPERVLTGGVQLLSPAADSPGGCARFIQDAVDRLAALPGVTAAGAASNLPMGRGGWGKFCTVEERPATRLEDVPQVSYYLTAGSYFRTLGISLAAGRLLGAGDRADSAPVAVINETAARKLFPGEDPIGKSITMAPPLALLPADVLAREGKRVKTLTIVGVVHDVRSEGVATPVPPEVYQTFAQAEDGLGNASFVLRTSGDPALQAESLRRAIAELDPRLPVLDVQPMTEYVGASLVQARFDMTLLVAFAVLALVLALVGVYGVMSYAVSQRTRELGIRVALGATAHDVLRLVLRQGLRWVGIGLLLGAGGALALTRVLAGMLHGVSAVDPASFLAGALLLASSAGVALWVPARRATRVDPMVSLRGD